LQFLFANASAPASAVAVAVVAIAVVAVTVAIAVVAVAVLVLLFVIPQGSASVVVSHRGTPRLQPWASQVNKKQKGFSPLEYAFAAPLKNSAQRITIRPMHLAWRYAHDHLSKTCQAPKLSIPLQDNNIRLSYEFYPIS
jgi:hypothetical protein